MEGTATVDDRGHPGSLVLKSHLKASEAPAADPAAWCGLAGTDGDLSLETTTLPLAMFQCIAARGVPGLKLAGTLGSNLDAQWTGPGNVKFSGSVNGSDLCVASPSLGSNDFRVAKVQAACKAVRQDKQLTVEEAKIDCDLGSLAASGQVDLGERGLQTLADLLHQRPVPISGTISYQGDMQRLQPWIVAASGARACGFAGRLSGTAHVQQTASQIVCKAQNDIQQLVVAAPSGQSFQEPQVHCAVQCSYQIADKVLKIDQCELSSGVAAARVGGQIVLVSPGNVQLSGDVSYQWDKLNLLVAALLRHCHPVLRQRDKSDCLSRPVRAGPGRGQRGGAVQRGQRLWLPGRPGRAQGPPGQRRVAGRSAGSDLQPGTPGLAAGVAHGPAADGVSPLGRHAGQPDPTRSGRLPLGLEVRRSHVGLGHAVAGPVLDPVGRLPHPHRRFEPRRDRRADDRPFGHDEPRAVGASSWLRSLAASPSLVHIPPESVIQFRMTGGRIYHQGLALEFPDVTMRTYGSVGLDDSLKLMVETSVPLNWLPSNAVTDAIRKQKMQIPVGGTLKSPQLDLGELARVKNQVLGNLARSVLQSGLGNQLNRLLQPQK